MHDLKVGGQKIGTMREHPFYAGGKSWTNAGELARGDRIPGLDPRESVAFRGVSPTGRYEKVYNLCVADYHTYFVGDADWGFALWAHNSYRQLASANLKRLGLDNVKLAGKSYNAGRKALKNGGFRYSHTTSTGRKVFVNARTGTQVYYDSGRALAPGQRPHWHIVDSGGQGYSRTGRPVFSFEGAGHIPGA